jgi:hypothetical protein
MTTARSAGAIGAVTLVDPSGNTVTVGGGDASAANQTTQISHESRLTSSASGVAHASPLATTAFMAGGQYRATIPTFADLEQGSLLLDSTGRLLVSPSDVVQIVSVNFTRPADTTAYASGDLVANSTTAGSVVPMTFAVTRASGGTGAIVRARLKKTTTGVTNAAFRVHLHKNAPTYSNGDNGAWLTTESLYLGSFDITMDRVFSDGAKGIGIPVTGNGQPILFDAATGSQNIYAEIEARGAYTPGNAEVFTLTLEVVQN